MKEQSSTPWSNDPTVEIGSLNPENIEESNSVKILRAGGKLKLPTKISGTRCRYSIAEKSNKNPFPFADVHPEDYKVLVYSEDGGFFSYSFGDNIYLPNKTEEDISDVNNGVASRIRKTVAGIIQRIRLPNPVPAISFEKDEKAPNAVTIKNLSDRDLIITIIKDGEIR